MPWECWRGSEALPRSLCLCGAPGEDLWPSGSDRVTELFKLEKTFKIPKPTPHHACCPCPSLPHLCSPEHLQGRGFPHPEQPWQPIPVPDTSQVALWVCTELLGCLIWGTAPEDKQWVKTYIISGLKIYTFFFFLNFRQLSHCLSRNFYPKPEIAAIKGKDEKWGEKQRRASLPPLLPAPCEAACSRQCALLQQGVLLSELPSEAAADKPH